MTLGVVVGAAKAIPAAVGAVGAASKIIPAAAGAIGTAGKVIGAVGVAHKVIGAVGTAGKLVGGAVKAVPLVGAAVGGTKLIATIATAIKAATAIIGIGKLTILPILIVSLAYYNYDLFDPENRPFIVKEIEREYDFIIIGGGSAGTILANRLSEVNDWKILLLEAGGHETEISDVPILSLYLHKSKMDWKYR